MKTKLPCPGTNVTALRVVSLTFFTLFSFLAVSLSAQDRGGRSGNLQLPSNPMAGRIVFEGMGCIKCHAVDGYGGTIGPDLGPANFFGGYYDVASRLWNHAPQMAIRSLSMGWKWSTLTTRQIDELITFLFYLRYLGETGSVSQGKQLVRAKGCLHCHTIGDDAPSRGIAFDQLDEFASPMYIAQSIWNHGPEIQRRMEEIGLKRPVFKDDEINHISTYFQELSRGKPVRTQYISIGNPKVGAQLFMTKGCATCHAVSQSEDSRGTRLPDMNLNRSVTAIAGTMWNHIHLMVQAMHEEDLKWPSFEASELADLMAYLYFFDYIGTTGDAKAGQEVFKAKQCIRCHGSDQPRALSPSIELNSPTELIRTMWNHVPFMHEEAVAKNIAWPELTASEFQNLYTYLTNLAEGE
jgi:mono/diheme cytochrome c family protein